MKAHRGLWVAKWTIFDPSLRGTSLEWHGIGLNIWPKSLHYSPNICKFHAIRLYLQGKVPRCVPGILVKVAWGYYLKTPDVKYGRIICCYSFYKGLESKHLFTAWCMPACEFQVKMLSHIFLKSFDRAWAVDH